MKERKINLLGATGSIGKQTLALCRRHPEIKPINLTAKKNYKALAAAAREFGVKAVCIGNEELYKDLCTELADTGVKVLAGISGISELAADTSADITLNAIVGAAGLLPTEAAIKAHIDVALANKETLVTGGSYIMRLAKTEGVTIYPVDSEHSAIFQCLQGCSDRGEVRKLILTASGGPFFGKKREELEGVTAEQALRHPNWDMGAKITIDSATMMNKGFELIEACHLFGVSPDKVEIVVHRQSVIHSAVEYADGAVIAQMGVPDMTVPIQYAITYPRRLDTGVKPLNLFEYGTLTFEKPDMDTFTCLKAACHAADDLDGCLGAYINGANEILVREFLAGHIRFTDIFDGVTNALEMSRFPVNSIDTILYADKYAREEALRFISKLGAH